jgi:NAD(P)-dependent dehydrogenase (short-subunit alcohol dehydrogenase family)
LEISTPGRDRSWRWSYQGKVQPVYDWKDGLVDHKNSPKSTKFVQCDTGVWEDQVQLFREAASLSPTGKISYVVANAGIHRVDEVFQHSNTDNEPERPDLSIIDNNIKGPLFTAKLAAHYFIRQNGQTPTPGQQDTCLILVGSGAAFLDVPRSPQYSASKWAMRGVMHSLRRTAYYYGSRVNVISPWYRLRTVVCHV